MALGDMVTDVTEKITHKAGKLWEAGKLRTKIHTDTVEADLLKKKIGEVCFGKYRAGDELDPEVESLCRQIEGYKRSTAECRRKLEEIRKEAGKAPAPGTEGVCPFCGENIQPGSRFCPLCGQPLT